MVGLFCFDGPLFRDKEMNMKPLSLNNISVIEVSNLNTIKGFFIDKIDFENEIKKTIDSVDLIFSRMPSQISNVIVEIAQKKNKPYLVEVGGCAWDSFWNHGVLGKIVAPYMFKREEKCPQSYYCYICD